MDLALLGLFTDDRKSSTTRTAIGRGMLTRLRQCETEAGFTMRDSPTLDNAPDGIDYLGLRIVYNDSEKYGRCIHITQTGIMGAIEETLERGMYFHMYSLPSQYSYAISCALYTLSLSNTPCMPCIVSPCFHMYSLPSQYYYAISSVH